MTVPRGVRNNNPGNIRISNQTWEGLTNEQPDPSFFTFKDSVHGIRAIVVILHTYSSKYGLTTIREIINRWAPPKENDTGAYVEAVSNSAGVDADDSLNLQDTSLIKGIVKGIILHENGEQPYPDNIILEAISLAGAV
jgi:hypothetical protein